MTLHILRALFVLLMASVGWSYLDLTWKSLMVALALGVAIICIDILAPRKKLAIFSGTFLGLLVGICTAYALSFIVELLVDQAMAITGPKGEAFTAIADNRLLIISFINLLVGVSCCYLAISFILQTKDDFRFIIPYVEFNKQTKGARPILLDTSVLIDGRITDIANTGIMESQLIVPQFVLDELQSVADSSDKLKRNRGRRGLDVLTQLRGNKRVEIILYDSLVPGEDAIAEVDSKLVFLAKELGARVLTNDFNLNKIAQLRGVDVININELATALKPVVLPGERMMVRLVKSGEEPGQGVGYLDDGTMVVVDQGRQYLNEEVEFSVTSVLQTAAGKMIFGRMGESAALPPRRPRPMSDARPATT